MRWMSIVLLLFAACAPALPHLDECVNPAMESMSWRSIEAPVTEVRDDAIIVDGRVVHFGGVALDASAKPFLRKYVGKTVTVFVNPNHYEDREMVAMVEVRGKDLNEMLLKRGLARYAEPPAYSTTDYDDCIYRIAEREARASRTGIWSR